MFEKIMDFMRENCMEVTNPKNTYEYINVVDCKEMEDFLMELFDKKEEIDLTLDRYFW